MDEANTYERNIIISASKSTLIVVHRNGQCDASSSLQWNRAAQCSVRMRSVTMRIPTYIRRDVRMRELIVGSLFFGSIQRLIFKFNYTGADGWTAATTTAAAVAMEVVLVPSLAGNGNGARVDNSGQ